MKLICKGVLGWLGDFSFGGVLFSFVCMNMNNIVCISMDEVIFSVVLCWEWVRMFVWVDEMIKFIWCEDSGEQVVVYVCVFWIRLFMCLFVLVFVMLIY